MLGAVLWLISIAGVCVLFGKEFLTSPLIGYYILNTALMLGIALSLSYLVGIFVKNSNMLNGISNLLSLGMCFLCGTFVPMSIMNKSVLKIAQFLPVYWYESINETLAQYKTLPVVYQLFSQLQGLCIKRKFQPVPENVPDPLPVENVLFR